jgi:hypothetical protein
MGVFESIFGSTKQPARKLVPLALPGNTFVLTQWIDEESPGDPIVYGRRSYTVGVTLNPQTAQAWLDEDAKNRDVSSLTPWP